LSEGDHEIRIVDAYQYAVSFVSKVAAEGYIGMVKTIPQLYGFIYDRVERAKKVSPLRTLVSRLSAQNLRAFIRAVNPSCVVCTHAFPCGVMSQYKTQVDPALPVVGIVTDFVVHPFWIYRDVDAYAVATNEIRAAMIARGVAGERISVTGIPVDPRFAPNGSQSRARSALGLPLDRRIALVMGGGLGIGPLEMMLEGLARVEQPLTAVVLVGRNARRERRLIEWAQRLPYPVRIRGFEENVYDYMHAADLLLTKPGGLTVSEALAARLPMVLVKPLPGQEQRNTRYLCERRAALRALTEDGIARAVDQLLAADGARKNRILNRADMLRRPEAAADVAGIVNELVERRIGALASA
jgi:processive 1,2-diacylglycerol beta-glucosyltransferase